MAEYSYLDARVHRVVFLAHLPGYFRFLATVNHHFVACHNELLRAFVPELIII